MRTTLDETKDDLIAKAADLVAHAKGSGGPPADHAAEYVRHYYRHVAPEDVLERTDVDLCGAALSQYHLALHRPPGRAAVRVFTPTVAEHGWSAGGHTVVEVVTDDMPFLVDSLTMELNEQNRNVHVVVHPQLLVRRSLTGELLEIYTNEEQQHERLPHDVFRESWMHIEIDRETEPEHLAALDASLTTILRDVREAVEDWDKMCGQVHDIVADLDKNRPPLPEGEVEEGKALLGWLADDHFTFLGRTTKCSRASIDSLTRAVYSTESP